MSDDLTLTDLFLTGMITYGPPAFGLALLLGAVGLPLPGTLLVIAAGAFVWQGGSGWAGCCHFWVNGGRCR